MVCVFKVLVLGTVCVRCVSLWFTSIKYLYFVMVCVNKVSVFQYSLYRCVLVSSTLGALPFWGCISNQMRKIACTSKVGGYAGGSIVTARCTQARQVSADGQIKSARQQECGEDSNLPVVVHLKIKASYSRLRVGLFSLNINIKPTDLVGWMFLVIFMYRGYHDLCFFECHVCTPVIMASDM
jgi:hypothetical protein